MVDVSQQANLQAAEDRSLDTGREAKMSTDAVSVFYGDKQALKHVSIKIYDDLVTAYDSCVIRRAVRRHTANDQVRGGANRIGAQGWEDADDSAIFGY